jgi:hypothetical protein
MPSLIAESLSIELFEQITTFLPPSDQASLCRVNRNFQLVTIPVLYRSISIINLRTGILCLRSICLRQELARAVKQFTLFSNQHGTSVILSSVHGLLNRSIQAMSNVVELRILKSERWSNLVTQARRTSIGFTRSFIKDASLKLQICDLSGDPEKFIHGDWFAHRPHIVELHIDDRVTIDQIQPNTLPNLQRLFSNLVTAALLLPGRPVDSFGTLPTGNDFFEVYHEGSTLDPTSTLLLGRGSVSLKVFECRCEGFTSDDFIHLLNSLSLHSPMLEAIQIDLEKVRRNIPALLEALEVRFGRSSLKDDRADCYLRSIGCCIFSKL